ncbi:hypothetical protein [Nitratifractor sp.]
MSNLRAAAQRTAASAPEKEILSFECDGQRYWLKRGRKTGSNPLHYAAWGLSRFPLLIPVSHQSRREALRHESGKIRRLASLGIPVPRILIEENDWFVMSHTGPTLRHLLYRKDRNDTLTLSAFEALGRLHAMGEYHGGSQLRNLTWAKEQIHFIDFEENFSEEVPLETLQLRDLFLLLFSFAKDRISLDYRRHIDRYRATSGNEDFDRRLRDLFARLGWLEKIITFSPIWSLLDKDTKATHRLIQEIKHL